MATTRKAKDSTTLSLLVIACLVFFQGVSFAEADDEAMDQVVVRSEDLSEEDVKEEGLQYATFGAGEYHLSDARFGCIKGVLKTDVGHTSLVEHIHAHATPGTPYIGTDVESVRVQYDSSVVPYSHLLDVFWLDTNVNHYFEMTGPKGLRQYAPVVYCHNPYQCKLARQSKLRLEESMSTSLITQVLPNGTFALAPLEDQKFKLKERHEIWEALLASHPDHSEEAVTGLRIATVLNSYLAGGCKQPWEEVEEELKDLELGLELLQAMGLEELHPDVTVVPHFGSHVFDDEL